MAEYLTMHDLDVAGRRVLVRSDLNVPLEDGEVADDFRIRAALTAISLLRADDARVIVCSHLGRPKDREPEFRLDPVARRMSELADFPVRKLDVVVGLDAQAAVGGMAPGDVVMLENTRFEPGETKNDPALADGLAALCDLFVQDAFGSVHRAHASTVGVAERVRSGAGPLLVSEVESLGRFLGHPDRPYLVVLGGAKVSDKLGVIQNLLPRVDTMLVGGGMCFTMLAARGVEVGESNVETDRVDEVGEILTGADGGKVQLPVDIVVAESFDGAAEHRVVPVDEIPSGWMGLDIGPETADRFAEAIGNGKSVFWNGPMGVFEWEAFREGTERVARAIADVDAYTAVGGGDSAAAMRLLGMEDQVSHLSTGGGAGLEMLEGKELPGVEVLKRWAGSER